MGRVTPFLGQVHGQYISQDSARHTCLDELLRRFVAIQKIDSHSRIREHVLDHELCAPRDGPHPEIYEEHFLNPFIRMFIFDRKTLIRHIVYMARKVYLYLRVDLS